MQHSDLAQQIKRHRHSYEALASLREKYRDIPTAEWNRAIKAA